jgi:RNA polymerase sigma factor (sigma-70 family)
LSLQAHPADVAAPPAEESPAAPLDIAALTRRMAKGDEWAYRTFYDAYFHRLSRYLLVVTAGDEDAAREALQAALVRVVRHIKPFPDEGVFWSWLTVLARSALSDQTRKRRRYLAFLDRFTQHARVERSVSDDHEADNQLLAFLERGLAVLPDEERDLVERKYFTRQSVREIAGELETSEKAIESRLVRIRRKLKAVVLDELKHESL